MIKLKILTISATALLFLLALVMSCLSIKHLADVIPADSYEDKGIYTFSPYEVLPLQMQNTSAYNRDRRMHKNKTIYVTYYKAIDGSGYTWNELAADQEQGIKTVKKGDKVSRRVLKIPADNSYITIEPEQNAKSYTAGLKQRYIIPLVLAGTYIFLYTTVWCVLLIKKHKQN